MCVVLAITKSVKTGFFAFSVISYVLVKPQCTIFAKFIHLLNRSVVWGFLNPWGAQAFLRSPEIDRLFTSVFEVRSLTLERLCISHGDFCRRQGSQPEERHSLLPDWMPSTT